MIHQNHWYGATVVERELPDQEFSFGLKRVLDGIGALVGA